MRILNISYPPGATPLDPNEITGLIPDYITTQGELNELEQQNIQQAVLWVKNRRNIDLFDPGFFYELHKRMFNQVWKWAGKVRTSERNIGVDWRQISTQVACLLADAKYWLENRTFPTLDETGIRFHHRLVEVHAFPNGNGRHARLVTDLLMEINGEKPFSWGMNKAQSPMEVEGERRREYITALQAADTNEFDRLIKFARS